MCGVSWSSIIVKSPEVYLTNTLTQSKMATVPLVLSVGAWNSKVGLADDSAPSAIYPSFCSNCNDELCFDPLAILSRPAAVVMRLWDPNNSGCETLQRRHFHELVQSISHHTLSEQPLMLVLSHSLDPKQRDAIVSGLMEELDGPPAIFVAHSSVCHTLGCGVPSGLVADVGQDVCNVSAVVDGMRLTQTTLTRPCGGATVTSYLFHQLLAEHGLSLYDHTLSRAFSPDVPPTDSFRQYSITSVAEELKHCLCCCGPAVAGSADERFLLPDGTAVKVPSAVRYSCTSQLLDAVADLLITCKKGLDVEIRQSLPVICGGGPTLASRFTDTLRTTLQERDGTFTNVTIAGGENAHTDWYGGAIVSSSSAFEPLWFTRRQYGEEGLEGLHRHVM